MMLVVKLQWGISWDITHVEENKKKIVRQTSASSWEQKGTEHKTFPVFFPSTIFSIKGATALLLHFPALPLLGRLFLPCCTDFLSHWEGSQATLGGNCHSPLGFHRSLKTLASQAWCCSSLRVNQCSNSKGKDLQDMVDVHGECVPGCWASQLKMSFATKNAVTLTRTKN